MHSFEDKAFIVTGGTRGIGWEVASTAAARGARVALCGRAESVESARARLDGYGLSDRMTLVVADVSLEDEVERLFDEASTALGDIHVVVNNAAVTTDALLVETSLEEWNRILSVNLRGAFLVLRRAAEEFIGNGGGRIVNMASYAAHGMAGQGAYSASKSALLAMSRCAAKELGRWGIACNAVAPAFVDVGMSEILTDEKRRRRAEISSMNRFACASEVAEAVLFLASDEASFVTGDTLYVTGGVREVPCVDH